MIVPGTTFGSLSPRYTLGLCNNSPGTRAERCSGRTRCSGDGGGDDWVREADSPKPAAADQTRYTFKDLNAARTKSIAMTGADKAATQQ